MHQLRAMIVLCCVFVGGAFGQGRQPFIINGLPTGDFATVGIVGEASVGGFCSGTLITSTHVLTAAHCAEAILLFGDENSGTFEVGGKVYRTTRVEIMPSYDRVRFTDDVAILVLSEPVPAIQPAELSDVPPGVGERVTIVGFGGQGTPAEGSDGSFGTKLVGQVIVDQVTDNEFSWIFDDPTESNPAPGDSGGPVFIESEQGILLAGIVSSGTTVNAELGDNTFIMRVDAYEPWITEVVLATLTPSAPNPPTDDVPAPDEDPPAEPTDEENPMDPDSTGQDDDATTEGTACHGNPSTQPGKPHKSHGARQPGRFDHGHPHGGKKPARQHGPDSRYAPRRPPRGHQRRH